MKKILHLFTICLLIGILSSSCKGNGNGISKDVDTVWNEHVQNVFFDTPFGSTQSEVISNFAKRGITTAYLAQKTEGALMYSGGIYYICSFGDMNWHMINVGFSGGKFNCIKFYNAFKDKASALESFQEIKNAVGAKYKISDIKVQPTDTTTYDIAKAFGKDNRTITIYCQKKESMGKEVLVYVILEYFDNNYTKASSEL